MATKQYTLEELEAKLEQKYLGKNCKLSVPGKEPVYGLVDRISVDTLALAKGEQDILIQVNSLQYTVSLEMLTECLKRL